MLMKQMLLLMMLVLIISGLIIFLIWEGDIATLSSKVNVQVSIKVTPPFP